MRPLGLLILICLAGCGTAGVPYAGAGYEEDYLASRTILYCSCSDPDTQQDIPEKH